MLDRRRFLTATAATAAVGAALPVLKATAQDAPSAVPTPPPVPADRTQVPAFYRVRVGDAVVTAIGDGGLNLPASLFPGISAEEFAAAMRANFLPEEAYPIAINAFVVATGGNVVLIDAGAPPAMAPTVGQLIGNLEAAGFAPGAITHVLLTHMHGDHVGNMIDGAGAPLFPTAEVVVRDRELTFWTDPTEETRIPEAQREMAPLARSVATAYQGRIRPFAGDVAVLDGIEAVAIYGHTPGHTGYRITSGEGMLVWGDTVHVAPLQMPKPETAIAFDIDPSEAAAARRRTLDMVSADRTLIAGAHLAFPSFGHVVTEGTGYRFAPAPFRNDV